MGEIRFVGTGETRGYPYLVCKKRIVGPGKTRGYPYPVCKKLIISPMLSHPGPDKNHVYLMHRLCRKSCIYVVLSAWLV